MSDTELPPEPATPISPYLKALSAIDQEREYQRRKWGDTADDTINDPWKWTAYLVQYAGSWMRGRFILVREDTDLFYKAMVKVATIAVAALESIERQRAEKGKPFYEA